MRKEYQDRFYAPIVNPSVTLGEYEEKRASQEFSKSDFDLISQFESMLADESYGESQAAFFAEVEARSESFSQEN